MMLLAVTSIPIVVLLVLALVVVFFTGDIQHASSLAHERENKAKQEYEALRERIEKLEGALALERLAKPKRVKPSAVRSGMHAARGRSLKNA